MGLTYYLQAHVPAFLLPVIRLQIWLMLLCAVFLPLEHWFSLRHQPLAWTTRLKDVGLYFVNSLTQAYILTAILSVCVRGIQFILPALPAWGAQLPLPAKWIIGFFLGDFCYYWAHRFSHSNQWLWRFHAMHHEPRQLYFMINTHAHPFDILFTRLASVLPMFLLGLAAPNANGGVMAASVIVLGTLWGFAVHANLRWRLTWMSAIVATPHFHHWHHTARAPLHRNFAAMLPIFDKLFGSWYLPQQWPVEYGIVINSDHEVEARP